MSVVKNAIIVFLFSSAAAMAEPASEDSIKQLLTEIRAQSLLDSVRAQVNSLMDDAIQQALKGTPPTASQQQVIVKMKDRMIAAVQEELSWDRLEPMYVRLYKESYTEDEIAGMLTFFKTPAGQAVTNKMPLVTQKIMQETHQMTLRLSPKLQKIQQDFCTEMTFANN